MAAVDVKQLVGEQAAVDSVPFAEVGGELEAVLVLHRAPPTVLPSAAAATPAVRLKSRLTTLPRGSPSSVNRWLSSIHVENVVKEPIVAVPATSSWSLVSPAPVSAPSTNAPRRLISNVPKGKSRPTRLPTWASSRKRATAPTPPKPATATHRVNVTRTFSAGARGLSWSRPPGSLRRGWRPRSRRRGHRHGRPAGLGSRPPWWRRS